MTTIARLASFFLSISFFIGCNTKEEVEPEVLPDVAGMPDLIASFDPVDGLTADIQGQASWNEGDGLKVFVSPSGDTEIENHHYVVNDLEKGLFSICVPDTEEKSSAGTAGLPSVKSHDWYVMSPYSADNVRNPFGKPGSVFSLDGQVQDCKDLAFKHLDEYGLMTGAVEEVPAGTVPEVHLSHQVSIIRLDLANESDKDLEIQSVTLKFPEGKYVGGSYFVDFKKGLLPAIESNQLTLKLLDCRLEKGKSLPVYMVSCPFSLDAGEAYSVTVVSKEEIWSEEYKTSEIKKFGKGELVSETIHVKNGSSNKAFPNMLTVKFPESQIPVRFAADDQVKVFIGKEGDMSVDWTKSSHRFVTSDAEAGDGIFHSETGLIVDPASKFNAYVMSPYSSSVMSPSGDAAVNSHFSFDGQVQDGQNPLGHLPSYAVMTAVLEGLSSGQQAEAVLEHKTALVHVKIPNQSSESLALESLELIAPEGVNIGGTYSVDFAQGKGLTPVEADNHLSLKFLNAAEVAAGGMMDAYFVIPPISLIKDDYIRVKIHSTIGDWEKRITIKEPLSLDSGKMYDFTVDARDFEVSLLWTKTAAQQEIWHKLSGLAVNGKYAAVQTWGDDGNTHFILCDRLTGNVQKRVKSPWNYMMRVRTDAAGHFIVSRANYFSAGLHIWIYDQDKDTFKQLQWFDASAGCPQELGVGLSVCGDMTKGLSHIYATAPGQAKAYHFSFRDGNRFQTPNNPDVLDFPAFGNWTVGNIQRRSISEDSGFYYSLYEYSKVPESSRSEFGSASSDWNITPCPEGIFLAKILDAQVIEFGTKRLLVTDEQEYPDTGASYLRIYELSAQGPALLFESKGMEISNFNHWGNIGVWVEKTEGYHIAYIAVSNSGENVEQTNISMYKVKWADIQGSDQSFDTESPDWNPDDSWMN